MAPLFDILFPILLLALLVASQIFWIRRIREAGRKWIPNRAWRVTLEVLFTIYAFLWVYNAVPAWWAHPRSPVSLTAIDALVGGPFAWWVFGSGIGFLFVLVLRLPWYIFRLLRWLYRMPGRVVAWVRTRTRPVAMAVPDPAEAVIPSRRNFLLQAATAVGVVPFVGSFYGLVFERTDVQTTHYRVAFDRLPRGFHGFRIAQISDLHIGPFMSAAEIRRVAEMANRLKPDLILLTGDYVTWDASTQGAVVGALSVLRAPYGVIGTLGNHEQWTHTEASITRLFQEQGTMILRQQNATLRAGGDELNLIGVDYESRHHMGRHTEGMVRKYLTAIEPMVRRDTVNILMSHNPNTFDRAAALGIDLSLAGHTHGGQVTMEFISPDISPSRFVTPYVVGWFEKPGGKLYVNRGIGTIGVPMRIGAPPEITVYELVRPA
ncbi:MAG TPA: metallophosphoesterase [Terriglobia bacterium]|nr:metallophosphoesterase [Terriglobia bacterium]